MRLDGSTGAWADRWVQDLPSLLETGDVFGVLFQNPATDGRIEDCGPAIALAHEAGAVALVATDLMALLLLRSPADMGANVAIGSTQRFGVPMGFGGPHAAFL